MFAAWKLSYIEHHHKIVPAESLLVLGNATATSSGLHVAIASRSIRCLGAQAKDQKGHADKPPFSKAEV
jgi:hypothetical protein